MKKIILTVVAVALLLTFCSCDALTSLSIPYTFREDGEEYIFSGIGSSKESEIVVPETYRGKPVTTIGQRAFYYNILQGGISGEIPTLITSITLPETITVIGKEAFANNVKLKSLNIPQGVKSIGEGAFYKCASLTSITIPEGVTTIKAGTFYGCESLKTITIPSTVTSIESSAFVDCKSLESIVLPEGITVINPDCFNGCSSLKSFTISDKIVAIGDYAFADCTALEKLTIPTTVTTMGMYVFDDTSEKLEVSVYYDSTAPEGWDENWCSGMNGKAINTSEIYYQNIVVPNQAKAEELEQKIQECIDRYNELSAEMGRLNEASKPAQASGNQEQYKYYRDKIKECQEARAEALRQRDEYKDQLAVLKYTNQVN